MKHYIKTTAITLSAIMASFSSACYAAGQDIVGTTTTVIEGATVAAEAAAAAAESARIAASAAAAAGEGSVEAAVEAANAASAASSTLSTLKSVSGVMSVIGVVFGTQISESMAYRSIGKKGKYVCKSSTPTPTVNEPVEVSCAGIPLGGNTVIVPPVISFTDKPTSGGKTSKLGAGVSITFRPHHPPIVLPIALQVQWNTYEGSTTMGGDVYLDAASNYGSVEYSPLFTGEQPIDYGAGLNNAAGYNNGLDAVYGYDGSSYIPSTGTVADAADLYGKFSKADGYVFNGNMLGVTDTPVDFGNYSSGTVNDILQDSNESYNAGRADWATITGGNEGSSNLDNYFSSGKGSSAGNYDIDYGEDNKRNAYGFGGTYDYTASGEERAYSEGYSSQSTDNSLDGSSYFSQDTRNSFGGTGHSSQDTSNSSGGTFGSGDADWASLNGGYSSSITEDLFGNNMEESDDAAAAGSILASGGGVGNDGRIYDSAGNTWGSAEEAGLVAFTEGSEGLERILADGGWIDENGNVHLADGEIVGYITPGISGKELEQEAFEGLETEDKGFAMFNDLLKMLGGADAQEGMTEEAFFDSYTGSNPGSVLETIASTLGLEKTEKQSVRAETLSSQDMFEEAKKLLKAMGYTDEDIALGKSYDADSAYTEPKQAWNMNRITTLSKNYKIDTGVKMQKKPSSILAASSRFSAVKNK